MTHPVQGQGKSLTGYRAFKYQLDPFLCRQFLAHGLYIDRVGQVDCGESTQCTMMYYVRICDWQDDSESIRRQ